MFKTETHLHTAPVSSCARFSPEKMVGFYADAGYTTVFISDHFAIHHFSKYPEGLSWREKIDLLYGAFEKAKAEGDKRGLTVLFAPELSLAGNHYLLYGATKEFLYARKDVFDMTMDEFYAHAQQYGVSIIQAHPYRDGSCFPTPQYVIAVEAINSNPRHENFDDKCFALAAEHNFPVTAGSDAHRTEDIGLAAMISDTPITSIEQYLDGLKNGSFRLMKNGVIV